jgi:hypothetical protein
MIATPIHPMLQTSHAAAIAYHFCRQTICRVGIACAMIEFIDSSN